MKFATDETRKAITDRKLKCGVYVKVVQIPRDLKDSAQIGTSAVFRRALNKVFRIQGFDDYGHVELNVTRRDTIWIEPQFVVRAGRSVPRKDSVIKRKIKTKSKSG